MWLSGYSEAFDSENIGVVHCLNPVNLHNCRSDVKRHGEDVRWVLDECELAADVVLLLDHICVLKESINEPIVPS